MAARGTYQTKQKEVIADYFRANPETCVTAEEVYAALGAQVGMTTVYRAVARLCEEEVLRKYTPQSAGEAALYQFNPCRRATCTSAVWTAGRWSISIATRSGPSPITCGAGTASCWTKERPCCTDAASNAKPSGRGRRRNNAYDA